MSSVGLFGGVAGVPRGRHSRRRHRRSRGGPGVIRHPGHVQRLFGIPLSFAALLTGIGLGLGTKWGVLRYPWTVAKLVLVLTVILMGAFVLGPSVEQMRDGSGGVDGRILLGAIWDLAALGAATVLGVFKPGRARRGSRRREPIKAST